MSECVFHEIISYVSRPERTKVLKQICKKLKMGTYYIKGLGLNISSNSE